MSKRNKTKTDKKVTSITRKLYVKSLFSRIVSLFIMDVLLFCLAFFGWIYMQESIRLNGFSWSRSRDFVTINDKVKHIYFIISDKKEELLSIDATNFITALTVLMIIVIVILLFI